MAKVKHQEVIEFDDGDVYVLWYSNDEEGYGIEVVGEEGKGGDLVTMEDWSFGHGEEAHDLSADWGDYMIKIIHEQSRNSDWPIPKTLSAIQCTYNPENPESNLRDLEMIKELVKNDKL